MVPTGALLAGANRRVCVCGEAIGDEEVASGAEGPAFESRLAHRLRLEWARSLGPLRGMFESWLGGTRQHAGRSCIVRKELGFALRTDRCDTNRKVVSGRTFTAIPLDRRADRVNQRPEGQACRDRPPVVSQQHPTDPWVALRNPEGELRPRLDACRKKIVVRDPRETC